MDMGQAGGAKTAFDRVLELDRHNLVALRSLGELAVMAHDISGALRFYRELLTLDPGDEMLRATIEQLEGSAPVERTGEPAPDVVRTQIEETAAGPVQAGRHANTPSRS